MTGGPEGLSAGEAARIPAACGAGWSGPGPAFRPREPAAAPHARHVPTHGDVESPIPAEVPKNVALVIETSGSSGVPKRVALSADALLASAGATESELGGPGQWLLALPTHYIAGMQVLIRSIVADTTPVVLPPGHFSARAFAALIDELTAE